MKRTITLLVLCLIIISGCGKKQEIAGILDVPDTILEYRAEGNGIPCVVFTGVVFTGSEDAVHKLYSDELRKKINLIHADPSNLTSEQAKNLTLEAVLDDIEKVRKALGLKKIAVMSHSKYGPIALEYALKYPDDVSHSIITGARPYSNQKADKIFGEYWDSNASNIRKEILQKNLEKLATVNFNELSPTEQFIKNYTANVPILFADPQYDLSFIMEGIQYNSAFDNRFAELLMKDFDNTDKYHEIKTPVLVLAGRHDYWAPYFLWDEVKNVIPDFTFKFFENAGHNPMLELTEEFDKFVIDWIESKK